MVQSVEGKSANGVLHDDRPGEVPLLMFVDRISSKEAHSDASGTKFHGVTYGILSAFSSRCNWIHYCPHRHYRCCLSLQNTMRLLWIPHLYLKHLNLFLIRFTGQYLARLLAFGMYGAAIACVQSHPVARRCAIGRF